MRTTLCGRLLSWLLLAGLCLGLSGCLIDASSDRKGPKPTLGQELIDLQAAHEKGAINDEEYGRVRRELVAGHRHD